jgi:hypothetical protein
MPFPWSNDNFTGKPPDAIRRPITVYPSFSKFIGKSFHEIDLDKRLCHNPDSFARRRLAPQNKGSMSQKQPKFTVI